MLVTTCHRVFARLKLLQDSYDATHRYNPWTQKTRIQRKQTQLAAKKIEACTHSIHQNSKERQQNVKQQQSTATCLSASSSMLPLWASGHSLSPVARNACVGRSTAKSQHSIAMQWGVKLEQSVNEVCKTWCLVRRLFEKVAIFFNISLAPVRWPNALHLQHCITLTFAHNQISTDAISGSVKN